MANSKWRDPEISGFSKYGFPNGHSHNYKNEEYNGNKFNTNYFIKKNVKIHPGNSLNYLSSP